MRKKAFNLSELENEERPRSITHGFGVRGVVLESYIKDCVIHKTNQVHGNLVHHLTPVSSGDVLAGDAFITNSPGVVCFVRTADCVPILIADAKRFAVAAIHAGWRGTLCDVAGSTIAAMRDAFGTDPKDCVVAIGPRICGNCYEVGRDIVEEFGKLQIGRDWLTGERKIDLGVINRILLERAGITPSKIEVLPHCTSCDKTFASYRRDKNENERQFNFIVIALKKTRL